MKAEEIQETIFKEFTAILAKHNVSSKDADAVTMMFGSRWSFLPYELFESIRKALGKIPLSLFFELEPEVRKICLQASEDLQRLLTKRDEDASDPKQ